MSNEKRLIDVNGLVSLFTNSPVYGASSIVRKIVKIINDFPTVDAVEVVRCKDCWLFDKTGYDEDNEYEEDLSLHSGWCKAWRRETQGCRFCSYGERREGE